MAFQVTSSVARKLLVDTITTWRALWVGAQRNIFRAESIMGLKFHNERLATVHVISRIVRDLT